MIIIDKKHQSTDKQHYLSSAKAFTTAVIMACLLPFTVQASSDVNIKFPNGEYTESTIDMRVAAPGKAILLDRTWQSNRWYINPRWSNLQFSTDPLDNSIKTVDRAGSRYQRSGESDLYLFEQVFIRKTESGWRWYDRQGNWITYDPLGRMTAYGNTNDVGARFELDAQGRRAAIYDHFNQLVYQFEYDSNERLVKTTDRSGRSVNYHWNGDRLVKVTDVMGHDWLYDYDSQGQITQRTDPDGKSIKIGYTYTLKAPTPQMTSGKEAEKAFMVDPMFSTKDKGKTSKIARVGQFTDKNGAITLWNTDYDKTRQQFTVTEEDPLSKKTVSLYNLEGQLLSRAINGQPETTIERDGKHLKKVTDARGLTTVTYYDGNQHPIKVIYPDGSMTQTEYDYHIDKPTRYTDTQGTITQWQYDSKGNLLLLTEAMGKPEQQVTAFEYDAIGQLTTARKGPNGEKQVTTHYRYDNSGNLVSITDGEGQTTQFQHTIDGQLKQYQTPSGQQWQYQYDAAGLLTTITDPLAQARHYQYDAVGRMTEAKDPLGNRQLYQYDYDKLGQVITQTNALGEHKYYRYNLNGQPRQTESDSGLTYQFNYDEQGRLQQLIDAVGNNTTLEYGLSGSEMAGLVVATHYPTYLETYRYNRQDQLIEQKEHLDEQNANITRFAYNSEGLITAVTEPGELTNLHDYNALGQSIKHTDAAGAITQQAYDNLGQLSEVIDANGNRHQYHYDKNGRVVTETQPTGSQTHYRYNQDGQLASQRDEKGNLTQYQYDAVGQVISETVTAAGEVTPQQTVTFGYDAAGHLINIIQSGDTDSQFSYQYDALGRVINETITYGKGDAAFTQTLAYRYDSDGNLAAITYPDKTEVTFTQVNGQLKQATLANGKTIDWLNHQWYQPTTVKFPGSIETLGYDALMRPLTKQVNVGKTSVLQRGYTYNQANNIAERQTEQGTFNYQYDRVNRLIKATPPTELQHTLPVEEYAYDEVGNRLGSSYQPGEFVYGADNQLLQMGMGAEAVQFNYSSTGNVVEEIRPKKTIDYQYDAIDRLVTVKTNDIDTATYQYDPLGRRISKTVAGKTTWFIYSGEGLLAELNGSGKMTVAYGWKPDSMLGTAPLWQANLTDGQTLVNAEYHYLHTDHLGTPQIAVNEQGETTWQAVSEAFGKTYPNESNKIVMNLRFPGQYYDKETDSHYNYFRDYNPAIGRYKQRDPIGLMGGINPYGYVGGDPLHYTDPQGLVIPIMAYYVGLGALTLAALIYGQDSWNKSPYGANNADNTAYRPGDDIQRALQEYKKAKEAEEAKEAADNTEEGEKPKGDSCSIDDIIQDSVPDQKGSTKTYDKNGGGGYDAASKDFDRLKPENVTETTTPKGSPVKVGTLSDGRTVIVREYSKEGRPTLEIQHQTSRNTIKIRY